MHLTVKVVTSLAEVWIEMVFSLISRLYVCSSLPLRKCGLKFRTDTRSESSNGVTSLAEVWIEIFFQISGKSLDNSHFPCGSVD